MRVEIIIRARPNGYSYLSDDMVQRELELTGEPGTLQLFEYGQPVNDTVHEAITAFVAQQEKEVAGLDNNSTE